MAPEYQTTRTIESFILACLVVAESALEFLEWQLCAPRCRLALGYRCIAVVSEYRRPDEHDDGTMTFAELIEATMAYERKYVERKMLPCGEQRQAPLSEAPDLPDGMIELFASDLEEILDIGASLKQLCFALRDLPSQTLPFFNDAPRCAVDFEEDVAYMFFEGLWAAVWNDVYAHMFADLYAPDWPTESEAHLMRDVWPRTLAVIAYCKKNRLVYAGQAKPRRGSNHTKDPLRKIGLLLSV